MRVFVRYNSAGEIVSVSKVNVMPPDLEHPFGMLQGGESVVELPAGDEDARLDPLELHNGHQVDPRTKKLLKKQKR